MERQSSASAPAAAAAAAPVAPVAAAAAAGAGAAVEGGFNIKNNKQHMTWIKRDRKRERERERREIIIRSSPKRIGGGLKQ